MNKSYEDLREFYSHERSLFQSEPTTGTVYTPDWVAKQMVYFLLKNHIGLNGKINDAFDSGGVNFDVVYREYYLNEIKIHSHQADILIDNFASLSILDLSCGSGALLLAYLEFMEYLISHSTYEPALKLGEIISKRLYGVDIDPVAINGFKNQLEEFSISRHVMITRTNLFCLNSLLDDLPFEGMTFDLVIGNPPYIGEKNNLDWFKPIKATDFGLKYYEGKMDYFYFFIYKGWELLNETGSLCYLSSNYFLTADGAKKLRHFIKMAFNLSTYVDYGDKNVFPERKLHACVYVLQKKKADKINVFLDHLKFEKAIEAHKVYQEEGTFKFITSEAVQTLLSAMSDGKLCTLGEAYDVHQGIVSGSDRHFVYTQTQVETLPDFVRQYLVPFFKNSDIKHYYTSDSTPLSLLYMDQKDVHPDFINWLSPHREKLMKRREVEKNIRKWYMLTWPRTQTIFTSEKIVAPQRASSNRFAYVDSTFYASADVYYIINHKKSPYTLPVLTLILNSSLYYQWLHHMGKRKGNLLELYATPLKSVPLPNLEASVIQCIARLGEELYSDRLRPDAHRLIEIQLEVERYLKDSFNIE